MGNKGIVKKIRKTSSGNRRNARIKALLRRLNMKISRWNRNQSDPTKVEAGKSRNGWKTDRMCEHAQLLERALRESKKKRFVNHGET